jgi:hypothetical protein
MKKPFINTAHGWSGDDENTVNRTAIELSLKQFKRTNDPICLAQIIHHLDFHGVDEAKEVLSGFLTKEIRKTRKYNDALWWKNVCDISRRLRKKEEWSKASHIALSNYIYHDLGIRAKSDTDSKFSEALRKQLKKT